ncbi:lipase 3-like [Drosophila takahashii]|uniref:lipase 3-like n=1 Tax=Drosophila takahashii TaxID=29030 RepID=UPI001CF8F6C1|nr:lipase 3-like [Drosophila takahashii]
MLRILCVIYFSWLSRVNCQLISKVDYDWENYTLPAVEPRVKVITGVDIIAGHNYPVETHTVTTRDGYILEMFRIPSSNLCGRNGTKSVVLINHGMTGSADSHLLNGPNDGLPYLLADACYDVWLTNCRGTRYSRRHVKLKASKMKYWRFSWHEIGMEDLPAMINHMLAKTKQQAFHFVGHSQGTTSLMVLLSLRPEFNAKIKTANLMAPPIFMKNSLSTFQKLIKPVLQRLPDFELLPNHKAIHSIVARKCNILGLKEICIALYIFSQGPVSLHFNRTLVPLLIATHPAGISTRQPKHYYQLKDSGKFRPYDFGLKQNLALYKKFSPPDYPLNKVRPLSPIHLWYSDDDGTISPKDIPTLVSKLSSVVTHRITDPTWDHTDFLFSKTIKSKINLPIINIINEFESSPANSQLKKQDRSVKKSGNKKKTKP